MIKVNCAYCGKIKKVYPYEIKRSKRIFCDRKCQGKWYSGNLSGEKSYNWKEKIKRNCKYCEKSFEVTPYMAKNGRGIFCPKSKCMGKWNSENIRGENHSQWKGGFRIERLKIMNGHKYKLWRKSVFERDGFQCCICGEIGRRLNAHHIKNWVGHPELRYRIDNGMTMCVDCHRLVDKELPLFSVKEVVKTDSTESLKSVVGGSYVDKRRMGTVKRGRTRGTD